MTIFGILRNNWIRRKAYQYCKNAHFYFGRGNYIGAIEANKAALAAYPVKEEDNNIKDGDRFFFAEVHFNLGSTYGKMAFSVDADSEFYFKNSLEEYQKALYYQSETKFPELCAEIYNNIHSCQKYLGDIDAAINSLNRALKINPKYSEAYANLGKIKLDTGHYLEAIQAFTNAFDIKKNYSYAYFYCGKSLVQLADDEDDQNKKNELYVRAIASFTNAIKYENANIRQKAVYLGERYNVYKKTGQYNLAVEDSKQVFKLFPDYKNPDNWKGLYA